MSEIVEKLKLRKTLLPERIPAVSNEIARGFEPNKAKFDFKLKEILPANGSRRSKIFQIQKVMSEVREFSNAFVACKNGCSNCCYQRVMLSQTEADLIAHNIGRSAVQLRPDYKMLDVAKYSRETPCTFLLDGSCSIYANRPLMCRNYVNLDVDNLLCSFENWELGKSKDPNFIGVPMLGGGPVFECYKLVNGADIHGDIRDFFPVVHVSE